MSSQITPDERRLIDEAIAAGRITRVPRGASGFAGYIYDGPRRGVVLKENAGAASGRAGSPWKPRRARALSPEAQERRQRVRELHAEGCTVGEMVKQLNAADQVIRHDLKVLGLSLHKVDRSGKARFNREARLEALAGLLDDGVVRTGPELCKILGVSTSAFWALMKELGRTLPRQVAASRTAHEIRSRREAIQLAYERGEPMIVTLLARAHGVSASKIYSDLRALHLEPTTKSALRGHTSIDSALSKRTAAAERKVAKVRDRRRFKVTPPATGELGAPAPADATGTIFPTQVFDPNGSQAVLKDGANNVKIGGDVLVGRLTGARIFTLTLEERATCPKSCFHFRTCYGNSMTKARRFRHGPELEARIAEEVAQLVADGPILVRLHVLGDFYSVDYVRFWGELLDRHAGLTVFGFTAWADITPIGRAVVEVRERHPRRFWIRHSGFCGPWGCFTIDFPTERKALGTAIVCPEQLDANAGGKRKVHCGSCAACWSTDRPIVFMEHGR